MNERLSWNKANPPAAIKYKRTNATTEPRLRAAVWDKTDGRCWYCGDQTNPWRNFRIDHVIPVSKGGTDDLANLVPCCRSCNGMKSNLELERFRVLLGCSMGDVAIMPNGDIVRDPVLTPCHTVYDFYFERAMLTRTTVRQ